MRPITVTVAVAAVLTFAGPAFAGQSGKPITDRDPDVVDVAKTPVTDLNIAQDEIPELLIQAQRQPYDLSGLGRCSALIATVSQFDALLGPDLDLPQEERDRISKGRLAKTVVSSFIPFRGLIREVSGARDYERRVEAAIQAGLTRRGFLKGVGQSKGCKYPARPASREVIAARISEMESEGMEIEASGEESPRKEQSGTSKGAVTFTSQPVVQNTD